MTLKGMNDLDHTLYTDYPEFEYEYANIKEPKTLPPEKQTLTVGLDKRKMDGAHHHLYYRFYRTPHRFEEN